MLGRRSKGHAGIEGSPLADYVGCVEHDHDTTFNSYGTSHQECMQHNIRYLAGSVQNEPHLTWSEGMLELVREMIRWRNSVGAAGLTGEGSAFQFPDKYRANTPPPPPPQASSAIFFTV